MKRFFLTFALLSLLFPVGVMAQTVKNPTKAVFTVSPDHSSVTRYELGFFLPGATSPVQVNDLGTGAPVAGELERPLPSFPIGITYEAKIKAWAGTVDSDWSGPSNLFNRGPLAPTDLRVVK